MRPGLPASTLPSCFSPRGADYKVHGLDPQTHIRASSTRPASPWRCGQGLAQPLGGHPGCCAASLAPPPPARNSPSSDNHTSPHVVKCPLTAASLRLDLCIRWQLALCCRRHCPGHRGVHAQPTTPGQRPGQPCCLDAPETSIHGPGSAERVAPTAWAFKDPWALFPTRTPQLCPPLPPSGWDPWVVTSFSF